MKKQVVIYIVFALAVALIPAAGAFMGTAAPELPDDPFPEPVAETLTLLNESSESMFVLDMREYLVGALACEMPVSFEDEALKAQAVAIHSYALYMQKNSQNEYAFGVDTAARRGYMDREQRSAYYGASFAENEKKLENAVDSTLAYVLTYEGEPIVACFHAISTGRTEQGGNVFATSLPYLRAVDCPKDVENKNYSHTETLTTSDFSTLMTMYDKELSIVGEPEGWVGSTTVSESGTVLSISVCGKNYTGTDIRQALGLRSAAFDISYAEGEFAITTRGFGHGVGMSQNYANELAKQGKTFDEILAYFYSGTTLSKSV